MNFCFFKINKSLLVKFLLTFFTTLFLSACQSKSKINDNFNQKYGKEVQQIKSERIPPKIDKNNLKQSFEVPVATSYNENATFKDYESQLYYANVDEQEFKEIKPRQFFPDSNVYSEGKNTQSLPENLFDLKYNTALSPAFRVVKSEFDLVKIPEYDFYGVRTALQEKEYVLIGNNNLQKNLDKINASRSKEDVEMSEILIKEQRKLRRKFKMEKVFGVSAKKEQRKNN